VDVTPVPAVQRQPLTIDVKGTGNCAFTVAFGDGNQQEFDEALPHRLTHSYAVAGTYVLVVAPAAPCSGKFTQQVQVAPRAGSRVTGLTLDPPEAEVRKGVVIAVEGYGTCRYVIDYGDGNQEARAKPLPDRLHHVYNASGSYRIQVTASGACEGQAVRTLQVREPQRSQGSPQRSHGSPQRSHGSHRSLGNDHTDHMVHAATITRITQIT